MPKIPATQIVAKNRMDFPASEKSITNKTEAITTGTIQDKKESYPSIQTQFTGHLQGHQKIYDHIN